MSDQPDGFAVIVDPTTDAASVGDRITIKLVALRGTRPVQKVAVFVTAEGSAHVLDEPDISRMCIPDDLMGKENELRDMLESTPSLNVGKMTNADGRADFTVCFDRPGDAKINIAWLNPDTKVEDSIERLVAVFGDEPMPLVEPRFIGVAEIMARRELHCDVEAPDSVRAGSPATVRARVREHEKAASGIMVTLVPDSDNYGVLLVGDNRTTVPSDSGMTDSNGYVVFQMAQRAERPESVGYTVEWDNNGTVGKIGRSITFTERKEEDAMSNDHKKESSKPAASIEPSRYARYKQLVPYGIVVVTAAFLIAFLGITSKNEWKRFDQLFGCDHPVYQQVESEPDLTKVEAVPAPADTEPVVIAPSDAEASDAVEEAAAPVEQTDMVIAASAEDEAGTAESSVASEEPEIYTWYSTDGVLEVYNPKIAQDLEQGKKDAGRVQKLLVENSDLSEKITELQGQVSVLESQAGEEHFVIPRRIKCLGEDYTVHDGWITVHDCAPVVPKK